MNYIAVGNIGNTNLRGNEGVGREGEVEGTGIVAGRDGGAPTTTTTAWGCREDALVSCIVPHQQVKGLRIKITTLGADTTISITNTTAQTY